MRRFRIKRGDSFIVPCTARASHHGPAIDLTDWTIRSQVRTATGTLVEDLTVDIFAPTTGDYTLTAADTSIWPIWSDALLLWDVEYTDGGGRVCSTETVELRVAPDITFTEPVS